ncbi:MAG: ParB/RepB/Spo0J family partition protein [Clostridia bacterium]
MKPKKGLGKGLDALLGGNFSDEPDERIVNLDIDLIDANAEQPRKEFNPERIAELSDSIKRYGVIQPIIAVKNGERYLIVAGERRFRAAKQAGLQLIPAIIRDTSDEQILEIALIENLQRENLNPIEEAEALRFLMQRYRLTQDEVGKRIGKSRSMVANSVRLLTLPDETRALISDGSLSFGHAKVLLGVKDEKNCIDLSKKVVLEKLSVRELELLLKGDDEQKRKTDETDVPDKKPSIAQKKTRLNNDPVFSYAIDNLRRTLDTKVTIVGNQERGKIEIEYYSKENLETIYNLIVREE